MYRLFKRDVPCKDCLLIPICRNKQYIPLMRECDLLHYYLYHRGESGKLNKSLRRKNFSKKVHNVKKILGTESWYFDEKRSGYVTTVRETKV